MHFFRIPPLDKERPYFFFFFRTPETLREHGLLMQRGLERDGKNECDGKTSKASSDRILCCLPSS